MRHVLLLSVSCCYCHHYRLHSCKQSVKLILIQSHITNFNGIFHYKAKTVKYDPCHGLCQLLFPTDIKYMEQPTLLTTPKSTPHNNCASPTPGRYGNQFKSLDTELCQEPFDQDRTRKSSEHFSRNATLSYTSLQNRDASRKKIYNQIYNHLCGFFFLTFKIQNMSNYSVTVAV